MRASKARRLRSLIEALADFLEDGAAIEVPELFRAWDSGAQYVKDQRVRYKGTLYRCLLDHAAQPGWNPADAPSLWTRVLVEAPTVVPEWVQPESTNPYGRGDRVRHLEKIWVCVVDGNVWEPGVYGWEEVS